MNFSNRHYKMAIDKGEYMSMNNYAIRKMNNSNIKALLIHHYIVN